MALMQKLAPASVQRVIELAKKMNLRAIAEGVETQVQAHYLRLKNCDFYKTSLFEVLITVMQSPVAFSVD